VLENAGGALEFLV